MGEILAITWNSDRLELRQASSEGVWQPYAPPDKTVELNRPTRSARLTHPDSGAGLADALQELFKDIEITLPIWLLLPPEWVQRIIVTNPLIESPEMYKAHLLWEAGQRLSGDVSNYITLIPAMSEEPKLELLTTRKDIVQTFTSQVKKSGISITGVSAEPGAEERYSFETPHDFRDAIPVDNDEIPYEKPPISVSPVVSIGIGVVVIIAGVIFFGPFDKLFTSKIKPETAKPIAAVVTEEQTEGVQSESTISQSESSTEKPVETAAQKPQQPVVSGGLSPVHELSNLLPTGATITMAVLSTADLKVEIAGLGNSNDLITRSKQSNTLKNLRNAGTYTTDAGKVTLFRIPNLGWNAGNQASKDINVWTQRATTSGLKPQGRTAMGPLDSALRLLDTYWAKPAGFGKIYLAPEAGQWRVTIQ